MSSSIQVKCPMCGYKEIISPIPKAAPVCPKCFMVMLAEKVFADLADSREEV